MAAISLMC